MENFNIRSHCDISRTTEVGQASLREINPHDGRTQSHYPLWQGLLLGRLLTISLLLFKKHLLLLCFSCISVTFIASMPFSWQVGLAIIVSATGGHGILIQVFVSDCFCRTVQKSKSGRFCCSYFYTKLFSKYRKSRDIPGTSANQTRKLLLTADQLFHRIQKGLPDVVCSLGCSWKQLSVHGNMTPHLPLLCFCQKSYVF